MIHLVSSGDAGDDGFLAAEVSVESHGGDVSGLGNLFHGHAVKTVPGKQRQGCFSNSATSGEFLAIATKRLGA